MSVLVAFDCDKTLEIAGGTVPLSRLQELNIPPHIRVVIVSPSPNCKLPYPKFIHGDSRLENLLMAANAYPSTLYIYVSDNPGDDENARIAGYAYIHPKDFNFI